MSHYPQGSVYQSLYARYFDLDKMRQFMSLGGDMNGKNVIDLCGGTGRLASLIKESYPEADILLVDESRPMAELYNGPFIGACVADFLRDCDRYAEDVIFCQQAINYWFNELDAARLFRALKPGGKFIFNTFSNRPALAPTAKNYQIEGVSFMEISWYVPADNCVHHVQIREGLPMHSTKFQWIPKDDFVNTLSNIGFEVEVIERGASLTVVAVKPLKE